MHPSTHVVVAQSNMKVMHIKGKKSSTKIDKLGQVKSKQTNYLNKIKIKKIKKSTNQLYILDKNKGNTR